MVSMRKRVRIAFCVIARVSYLVLMWAHAEVFNSFTGVLGSSEEEGVASGWCSKSQLVHCQDLASSTKNTGASRSSESQSRDTELRNSQEAVIICDSSDDDNSPAFLLSGVCHDSGKGDRRSVDSGHE